MFSRERDGSILSWLEPVHGLGRILLYDEARGAPLTEQIRSSRFFNSQDSDWIVDLAGNLIAHDEVEIIGQEVYQRRIERIDPEGSIE